MHLLIPLLASFIFVASLICVKRVANPGADKTGLGPLTVLFFSNQAMALAFTFFWRSGDSLPALDLIWQPLALASLFMLGMLFTFAAIRLGDISIATPILGVKVVIVAALLSTLSSHALSHSVWLAATMAVFGIALIQWTGRAQPKHALRTITLAILATVFYAHFDVLLQSWAPVWGRGRLLAIVFWMVGFFSLPMVPWVQWGKLKDRELVAWLGLTSTLTMLQAFLVVIALAYYGDAARVNIVFALRGMWAVVLAWFFRKSLSGNESELSRNAFRMRFVGAGLLTAAVVLAIAEPI